MEILIKRYAMHILIKVETLYTLHGEIPKDGGSNSLCSKILSPMIYFISRSLRKGINTVTFLINYLVKKIVVIQAFLFPSWITEIRVLADKLHTTEYHQTKYCLQTLIKTWSEFDLGLLVWTSSLLSYITFCGIVTILKS